MTEQQPSVDERFAQLAANLPGFRQRPQQLAMARQVYTALSGDGSPLAMIEGPTGTGKSLAYLVGGSAAAARTGKRIVIATATVALQEQLLLKDIASLTMAGLPIVAGLAKGRSRYLCPARLAQQLAEAPAHSPELGSTVPLETLARLARELADGWPGDRDSCPVDLSETQWRNLTLERHACSGRRCAWLDGCPYYVARNSLRAADVIVANQDLLLADIEAGGGFLLPKPEETLYVIDEAHHFADKTIHHRARSVRLLSIERSLDAMPRVLHGLRRLRDREILMLVRSLEVAGKSLYLRIGNLVTTLGNHGPLMLPQHHAADEDLPLWRFPDGVLPRSLQHHTADIHTQTDTLLQQMLTVRERLAQLRETSSGEPDKIELQTMAVGIEIARLQRQRDAWELFSADPDPERPVARWIEAEEWNGTIDFAVQAAAILPGRHLLENLWGRVAGAVLTSATMTVGGSFDHIRRGLGLPSGRSSELRLDSPFDQGRAELHVPAMQWDPTNAGHHVAECIALLPSLLAHNQSGLVLFASRRQMQAVLTGIPDALRRTILVQGEMPRQKLLEHHRDNVENGRRSILAGLASFAEGIDLPGKLCEHVVIMKIPFAVPDHPIEQARAEWLERNGRNAFMEIAVPQAALRMAQACGRLLRHEEDFGRITVLDRRLVEKGYGRLLLRSLPPYTRSGELSRVAA